jgi:DHA2 family multidrug resistance protein
MRVNAIPRPALLAIIFVFILIEFLQSGMVVFAAGPTMGQIGASPEQFSLISALYAGVAVLSISQMTLLIQRLGWRDYLLASVLVFMAGAWTCAAYTTVAGFAAGRLLMAAGGAAFMSAARMLVNFIPPSPQRVAGIAAFGSALATGMAAAPWLAGVLVGNEAWSGMFLVLAALAAVAGGLALRYMPSDAATLEQPASRFHPGDGLALGAAAFLILFALQRLTYDWHGERLQVVELLAGGIVLIGWFCMAHGRRAQPFLRLEMLRSRRYLTGLLIFSLCYALLGVFNTLLPQLVQRVLGVAFEQAGQLQAAGMSASLAVFVGMLLVVRKHPHATKFYVTAFLLLACFGWHFAGLDPTAPAWTSVVPWLAAFGAFVILAMATTALHAFKDLQSDNVLFSNAQQFKNMLGQFGLALGAGGAGILLQERGAMHAGRLAEIAVAPPAVVAQQSSLLASIDLFWVLMWIGVAGAVALATQRRFD